jgi:hypothetical protein
VPTVDDQLIVAKVNACNGPGDGPVAANNYMQMGFANVYAVCEAFFVNATKFQQNALATNQTLDAGLVGATSIANATMSTASALKAITITTAGVVFGKSIMNDYVTVYTFGTHLYKVRQLVQNDMDNLVGGTAAPPNTCIAYANVQRLATKCTLSNMQSLLDSQVAIPSQVAAPPAVRNANFAPAAARSFVARDVVPTSAPPMSSMVVPLPSR